MLVGLIVFVAIVAAVIWFVSSYYNLVAARQRVTQTWANLDALLRQRHEELGRLVKLCERHLRQPQQALDALAEARSQVFGARHLADAAALGPAEAALRAALRSLLDLAGGAPELASQQAFAAARQRLAALETGIAERQALYNDAVTDNNHSIGRFPNNLVALMGGFRKAAAFELDAA
jgi:LemA protein